MFETLLVCFDGSEEAVHALGLTAQLARTYGAKVLALHVYVPAPVLKASGALLASSYGRPETAPLADETLNVVEKRTAELLDAVGVPYEERREVGHAAESIVCTARSEHANLIVLGSRGRNGWSALLLGGTSSAVLHHAPCPVLVAHGEKTALKNILFVTDGSVAATRAGVYAADLAWRRGGTLTVLNVCEPNHALLVDLANSPGESVYGDRLQTLVTHQVEQLCREHPLAPRIVQRTGSPTEQILSYAAVQEPDLIVMGSRGMGTFKSLLLGSVSEQVAEHATVPVLVVR